MFAFLLLWMDIHTGGAVELSVTAASVFLPRIPIFFKTFKLFSNPVTPITKNQYKILCGFEIYCITALVYCFRIPQDGAITLIVGY